MFVNNLPSDTTSPEIFEIFSKFGEILSIKIKTNNEGQCLGYGYINYKEKESAEEAIEKLNGYQLRGRKIKVNHFTSKKERGEGLPTPLIILDDFPVSVNFF